MDFVVDDDSIFSSNLVLFEESFDSFGERGDSLFLLFHHLADIERHIGC